MAPCKVLIADDHRVVIEGIKSLLKGRPQFRVVGEAVDGAQALDLAESLRPDLVVMDISMPGLDGVTATRRIKRRFPRIQIIIYTMHADDRFIVELLKAGISGHVLKGGAVSDLLEALEAVRRGETFFTSQTPQLILDRLRRDRNPADGADRLASLSPREMEVFRLLADGHAIKAIAERLCISPKTVETHKYNLMEKLNAQGVTDLTKLAIKAKIISV